MPFSCFLFRPRKSREKRWKRSHTNVSSTLSTRTSTPPVQTAHVRFHERKWVHTRLSEKDRTQGLTRRNRRHFGWGAIITLDTNCTYTNIPGPGIRTAKFAAFGSWPGVLPKNAESLRDSDAHDAHRCPAGVAAPPGRISFPGYIKSGVVLREIFQSPRGENIIFSRALSFCLNTPINPWLTSG